MKKNQGQDLGEFSRLWGGFRASRVILTANNLGLFEEVGSGATAATLAKALRTDPRATEILLDAVASLGLLSKSRGTYRLTPLAKKYLLRKSPLYQGDMLRHADTLWKSWSGLDDVVRTGRPSRSAERHHETFIKAMHNNAVMRAAGVLDAVSLKDVRRALDLGGGPGTYSIEMARRGVEVTLFDLPNTLDTTKLVVRAAGVKGISFSGGDFHFDDIGGPYDLALLSQVLHSHGPVENLALLGRVFDALAPKGRAVVHEFTLSADHASPVPGALFSVNMLVNTAEGRSYAPGEIRDWMKKTGFKAMRTVALGETNLVIGRK